MAEASPKQVLVVGRDGATVAALTDILVGEVCCDSVVETSEVGERIRSGQYALVVVDASDAATDADAVIDQVREMPDGERPLLFVLVGEGTQLPARLDPRVVTLMIRRPLEEGAVRDVLRQTMKQILAVGGETTLKRLRDAGAVKAAADGRRVAPVLVVDDERPIRELVATLLERQGLPTEKANDGEAAIERMTETRYSVVVLDLMMPKLSGWDVIGWLRAHPEKRPRTVIVCTAADRGALSQLDPEVVNAIFVKPFDARELGAYVRACADLPAPRDRRSKRIIGRT